MNKYTKKYFLQYLKEKRIKIDKMSKIALNPPYYYSQIVIIDEIIQDVKNAR